MPVQLKDVLHQRGYSVWDLHMKMLIRGHNVSYQDITRYGRCYKCDDKPRWSQIETCLREDFGIEIPW